MTSPAALATLQRLSTAAQGYEQNEAGAREALIEHSRALIADLEIPSEFLQRTFWAEPASSAIIRLGMDIKLFQHLRDAGDAGITPAALAAKTGVDTLLLQRLVRHLVSMHVVQFRNGAFHATKLAETLAAENYEHSIYNCYDVARPSFNLWPQHFRETGYKAPTPGGTDGPFQAAHKTNLPLWEWFDATPPQTLYFNSFMSAYRAGKPMWFAPGFYPVAERLIEGFDASNSDVLLVDVGGGRGHDLAAFTAHLGTSPGRHILQDREPVIASVKESGQKLDFEVQSHDFFTPQPVQSARAYFTHSICHDWSDEDSIRIMKNLVPALKPGYSRVLLNEIVINEEKPTLAGTSMDMMMLAHLGVRERTEGDWKNLLEQAGLKIVKIYTYPGVAESLIEAELA
ncbi:O-methyltransferase [Penicillium capsulatum]|uniref:O-methyltransferase n=1 Tax=Penicillium capsulatum TaxID=69766 RepID=A0A9W9ITB3_9EURO|nr:O-methyltransferase [Penicillium capsulatum]KAJ6130605.1 O-methyltransferase [Penicillium capsulatum]